MCILSVNAHPHDFTHTAGTLGVHTSEGDTATVVSVTSGVKTHNEALHDELMKPVEEQDPTIVNQTDDELAEIKAAELQEACAIFGVTDVRMLGFPQPFRFELYPEAAVMIRDVILDVRPNVLIMQSPYSSAHHGRSGVTADDHIETARATLEARDEAGQPQPGATPHSIASTLFPGVYFERDEYDFMVDVTDLFEQPRPGGGRLRQPGSHAGMGPRPDAERPGPDRLAGRYPIRRVVRPGAPRAAPENYALGARPHGGFRARRRPAAAHGRRQRLGPAPMSNDGAALSLRYGLTLGLTAMEGRGFSNPVDLAIASDGRIYVLSRTNPQQTEGIRVGILDLDSGYFGDFGSYGSGEGQFVWPTAIAFDSRDRLYLADEHNQRITVFDRSGGYLESWGVKGTADGELNGPSGLAFDSEDCLYVVDHLNHRVQKFTADGDWLLGWGRQGDAEGELDLPWGVAVGPDGNVYVADWRNDRVQKFTADGQFLAAFGGSGEERLSRPSGVAVDGRGRVYVADWGNERVRVFDADGGLVQSLRGRRRCPSGPRSSWRRTVTRPGPARPPTSTRRWRRASTRRTRSRPASSAISGAPCR